MFTIDLLKGQGIPIKKKPWGAAIAALAFAVPFFAAVAMLGYYFSNRIVIKVARQEIVNYDKNIQALSDAVELQGSFEEEKEKISKCLSEVSSSIGRQTQWSPILATVVEKIPHSMVLTKLAVKQRAVKKSVPDKKDPKKKTTISVQANTLQMSISGRPQANNDKSVKDFMDSLRFSAVLAPKIEDIVVSQEADIFEGQDVVSYDIDCIFRPEI